MLRDSDVHQNPRRSQPLCNGDDGNLSVSRCIYYIYWVDVGLALIEYCSAGFVGINDHDNGAHNSYTYMASLGLPGYNPARDFD